jgi:hypothetical protein
LTAIDDLPLTRHGEIATIPPSLRRMRRDSVLGIFVERPKWNSAVR